MLSDTDFLFAQRVIWNQDGVAIFISGIVVTSSFYFTYSTRAIASVFVGDGNDIGI